MHEQAVAPFGLYLRIAIDPHDAVKQVRRQRIAHGDQALVDIRLGPPECGKRWTWNAVCKSLWPEPSTLQRVDNEEVDDVNVVQRLLQAREEAGPLGFKRLLVQVCASREQPVVRPGVFVGESAVGLNKTGGHVCSLARVTPRPLRAHSARSASAWSRVLRQPSAAARRGG